ncbi:DUF1643 domain-containing protein [Devosia sp. PTR5]|uniref:DUF1643 domain-containing protein n=1 Tax=Devosia oryzisoli TaxID=2774138 RepID=A0A927FTZ1_9HYPH|nr:DUF1643 domain-containing protein [Devosia oryzisoli]MBD8064629.1 DUF1643 domain-containing protein [Devosia oryzisoli]
MSDDSHDPGGKVRLRLAPGVHGDAKMSADGRYRQRMRRWIGEYFPDRYIVFVGMNPSTADALVDDPTCAREWTFARREGFFGMIKCNVGDYRATDPKALLQPGVSAVSPANLPDLLDAAAGAARVVLCHGKLNKALAPAGREMIEALRAAGVELWCFGTNADGSPKHPLYLRSDTPLVPFIA